ncbi:MAG: response regulator [Anaerolineales bacterium]|nr:response regulator [Anaerolineales bacterium]MCB8961924.1 response regulator [Ardenticatenales bacterium]
MNGNTSTETIRILLIDDDEDDFLLTRRLLRAIDSHQFQLDWESNYHSALNAIRADQHDIYLIDYNLGQWDGLKLMEEALAGGCQKPMIVLTGLGEREIDLRAMARGAADYLVKGEFTPAMFERSLRYAIERSRNLRALQQSEIRYKELFEALRQSEMRYRGVVNAQVELVCRYRPNGTLTFVNPAFCRFVGKSREELIGTSGFDLAPAEIAPVLSEHIETLCATRLMSTHDYSFIRDDAPCWLHFTHQPILDNQTTVYEIQSVGWEITELKQTQLELQRALAKEKELGELKSRFVSMASHEFRTPLATIMSTTSYLLLAEHDLEAAERAVRLEKIKKAAHNMTLLLDDILTFGRGDAVTLGYQPESLEVVGYCRRLAEDLETTYPSHRIAFSSDRPEFTAHVDDRLLHHVLTNLLINAIKYSPQQDHIEFTLEIEADALRFRVIDFGIGIAEADQVHLFEPFHRGDNVKGINGTGLGLAICRQAAEAHGADIDWQSQPGEGTRFTVTIPLEQEA